MRYEDERYVRVYTRDTADWMTLSWQARGLFLLLLRKVDRAGILELGRKGPRAIAVVIGGPWSELEAPLAELLEDGCVVHNTDRSALVVPGFIAAQEAIQSDAARKRASRERARARLVVTVRDIPSSNVTDCPGSVTPGHVGSHEVTLLRSDPIQADPSRAQVRAHEEQAPIQSDAFPGRRIVAELRRWPCFADMPFREVAEMLVGRMMSSARPIEAVIASIGEAAADTVPGETEQTRRARLRKYCDRARLEGPTSGSGWRREPEPGPRYKTVAELEADQASKPRGPTAADRASLVAPPWKPKEPPPALDISALAGRKAL